MARIKLAISSSHPIQYQVPWIRGLAVCSDLDVKVYYGLIPNAKQQASSFGIPFTWDIPLLDGYAWELLPTSTTEPDLERFGGISTPKIYSRLRANRPDVLLITGWNRLTLVQAWLAGVVLRIPMLVRAESNAMRPRAIWKRVIHRSYLRTYDGYLAIGRSNRDFYIANDAPPSRIWDAPYFVEGGRIRADFEREVQRRDHLREAWAIPRNAFCFLYVGKLEPKKRILDLINAISLLKNQGKSIHLLVAGTGELMDTAKSLVARLSLPVTFVGFLNQTEIAKAYVVADCLVLPSDYGETWGLVVNEGMVCGLPAIVSDRVGCGPDLVTDGNTGYIFPFGDIGALANRMSAIAADPGAAKIMGLRSRTLAQTYSVEAAVAGTLKAVQAVSRIASH